MPHILPPLPYAYDALEPFIDARTMEIHHTKHHQGYVDKLNAALEKAPALAEKELSEILKDLNAVPEEIRVAVRNNGGGHLNHSFFWTIMKKPVTGENMDVLQPTGEIGQAIINTFGSFDVFKNEFSTVAASRFGSGWAWLVLHNDRLEVMSTPNQDTPISENMTPVLGLDVWEHAYYLKYQNRRPDYIAAFFNIINWERINELYI